MFKILLAEDDKNQRRLMEIILQENGYDVLSAFDGQQALDYFYENKFDLIILDVMMPKINGYEVAKTVREYDRNTPIIMITAKGEAENKKEGFLAGTDDYMVKPVDEEEMLLRIKALLRRANSEIEHIIKINNISLDYNNLSVTINNEVSTFPQKEFLLLFKLLSNPNKIYTKLQLLDEIWGVDTDSFDNTVNVHINRLRNRFENIKDFEIVTIRNLGYKAVINKNE